MKRSHHRCRLTPNGALCTSLCLARRPLNESSIQDALRAFLTPIKNDNARLDFYTVYKREATEYDMDYVKKYEDLNATLIFVRRLPLALTNYLTALIGRSVLRSQLCIRHRCPIESSA